MGVRTKRWVMAGLMVALFGVSAGCFSPSMLYFLGPEQRLPAKLKHLASDKKVEPKVLILTHSNAAGIEFIHADRQLAELLGRNLLDFAKAADEKLSILPQRRVEEFKNNNPDWKEMGNAALGRKLAADYVIYLEINSLSLYEPGSAHELFRGRASLTVQLVDVNQPDDVPMQEIYTCTFPSTQGPIPVAIDTQPMQFRQKFLEHVAKQLTYYFAQYPRSEQRSFEPIF